MASQVVRPRIPYRGFIPNGLHEGKLIEIKGSVPYGADVFEVNLLTGLDHSSDRPLHISVRFNGKSVVRNTFQQNQWGFEERDGTFPFFTGRDFQMMIRVDTTSYKIAINNMHYWEFVHRIPMSRVTSISIDGSVQVERIEFIDRIAPGFPSTTCVPIPGSFNPYPAMRPPIGGCIIPPPEQQISGYPQPAAICPQPATICPQPPSICPQPAYRPQPASNVGSNLAPVYNPSIPYAYPIYGGLKQGMMIYISGRPSASAYRFTLNLQSGTSPYPPPDIAFHFDVRFFNQTIIRNSRINNVFEREEHIVSHFPFQPAVNFDLIIRVDSERYMVALNGQHFLEFKHRLQPLSRFDTLSIENDIVVSSIRFA